MGLPASFHTMTFDTTFIKLQLRGGGEITIAADDVGRYKPGGSGSLVTSKTDGEVLDVLSRPNTIETKLRAVLDPSALGPVKLGDHVFYNDAGTTRPAVIVAINTPTNVDIHVLGLGAGFLKTGIDLDELGHGDGGFWREI